VHEIFSREFWSDDVILYLDEKTSFDLSLSQREIKIIDEVNKYLKNYFQKTPFTHRQFGEIKSIKEIYKIITEELYKLSVSGKIKFYPLLKKIAEDEVIEKISKEDNEFLEQILEEIVEEIQHYFGERNKKVKIGLCLQKDPEDPSFAAYMIVINTKIKNFEERNRIEDELCEKIENIIEDYKKITKDEEEKMKIDQASSVITLMVEGVE